MNRKHKKQCNEKYIAVWYVDVSEVAPCNTQTHMEAIKNSLGTLSDFLGKETSKTFFVPIKKQDTYLEIYSLGNTKKLTSKKVIEISKKLNKQQTDF